MQTVQYRNTLNIVLYYVYWSAVLSYCTVQSVKKVAVTYDRFCEVRVRLIVCKIGHKLFTV